MMRHSNDEYLEVIDFIRIGKNIILFWQKNTMALIFFHIGESDGICYNDISQ